MTLKNRQIYFVGLVGYLVLISALFFWFFTEFRSGLLNGSRSNELGLIIHDFRYAQILFYSYVSSLVVPGLFQLWLLYQSIKPEELSVTGFVIKGQTALVVVFAIASYFYLYLYSYQLLYDSFIEDANLIESLERLFEQDSIGNIRQILSLQVELYQELLNGVSVILGVLTVNGFFLLFDSRKKGNKSGSV